MFAVKSLCRTHGGIHKSGGIRRVIGIKGGAIHFSPAWPFFFFNDPAPTEISPLPLRAALPIFRPAPPTRAGPASGPFGFLVSITPAGRHGIKALHAH